MEKIKRFNRCRIIPLLILLPTLTNCNSQKETHYIVGNGSRISTVAVRAGNISFYMEQNKPKGIEHDLLRLFAERTNRTLQIKFVTSAAQALAEVRKGKVAIAAGLLSLPESEQTDLSGSTPYLISYQEIVYRYDTPKLDRIEDIVMKNIDVTDNPAQLDTLSKIKLKNNDSTKWHLDKTLSTHALFKLTEQGFVNHAVMDSAETRLFRLYYPSVNQSLRISEEMPLSWITSKDDETALHTEIEQFFAQIRDRNELANVIDRYYGHLDQTDYSEKLSFIEKLEQQLPKYKPIFVEVAKTFDTDWKLLAATSYQESHWDPSAQSPSGVVGMMMITKEVAHKFGAEPRDEPIKNIIAGAQYLLELKQRLPEDIAEPDRTWMALAAYNSGFGFLQKAMEETRKKQLDPTLWINFRDTLETLKNGSKVLEYVYNIRAYLNLMRWLADRGENDEIGQKLISAPVPPAAP